MYFSTENQPNQQNNVIHLTIIHQNGVFKIINVLRYLVLKDIVNKSSPYVKKRFNLAANG